MSDLTDDVDAVARGDGAAFERIVTATSARMVRLGARILGNLEDGEDVAQEAYVKAHRAIVEGRFDRRSKVETWLHRIVTNTAIDVLRSGSRRQRPTDAVPDAGWDGGAAAEARVALAELDSQLAGLPPDQRAALVLKAVEGRSAGEIAELLGTSEGAVEQLLVRARSALREKRS